MPYNHENMSPARQMLPFWHWNKHPVLVGTITVLGALLLLTVLLIVVLRYVRSVPSNLEEQKVAAAREANRRELANRKMSDTELKAASTAAKLSLSSLRAQANMPKESTSPMPQVATVNDLIARSGRNEEDVLKELGISATDFRSVVTRACENANQNQKSLCKDYLQSR